MINPLSCCPPRVRPAAAAALALAAAIAPAASGQVQFQAIPHGLDFENADAILGGGLSSDGSVVGIGYRTFEGWVTSYRHAQPGSLMALPTACETFPDAQLPVVSGDGNTFGGLMYNCTPGPGGENGAAFWTAADGLVFLGSFPNGVDWINGDPSAVTAISADGSVLVGTGNGATDPADIEGTFYTHAFRVVRPSTTLEDLGVIPGSSGSRAVGISADGTKILVRGEVPTFNGQQITNIKHVPAIWTEAGGHAVLPLEGLPPLYDGGFIAWGLSPDGGTVLGSAAKFGWAPNNPGHPIGFKWSAGTGYVPIPSREDMNLPICRPSKASADGAVVAGTLSPPSNFATQAFVWDAENGTRLVSEIVSAAGYDVTGWTFTSVTGLSADGRIVVGTAIRPDPELGLVFDVYRLDLGGQACAADWNGDQQVNSTDISAFLTAWLDSLQNGTLNADFNADGAVNSTDISAFLTAWLQAVQGGC